jgi:hypothetical protein
VYIIYDDVQSRKPPHTTHAISIYTAYVYIYIGRVCIRTGRGVSDMIAMIHDDDNVQSRRPRHTARCSTPAVSLGAVHPPPPHPTMYDTHCDYTYMHHNIIIIYMHVRWRAVDSTVPHPPPSPCKILLTLAPADCPC